jgi:hypothetical protein
MGMLNGRRILITGASRGIGAATARVCHREGAEITLHYGSSTQAAQRLADELGDRVHLVQGDLSAPRAADAVWDAAIAALGSIDVLVNNAGAWIASPLQDESDCHDVRHRHNREALPSKDIGEQGCRQGLIFDEEEPPLERGRLCLGGRGARIRAAKWGCARPGATSQRRRLWSLFLTVRSNRPHDLHSCGLARL